MPKFHGPTGTSWTLFCADLRALLDAAGTETGLFSLRTGKPNSGCFSQKWSEQTVPDFNGVVARPVLFATAG
jgi:hypothetical protein